MDIRHPTPAELEDCQAIYAHHVLHGSGTFEEVPPSLEEMTARFHTVQAAGFAWLVAVDASGVHGYGYYGPFRSRAAYRFTAEDSIYIRDSARGRGVGTVLLHALLDAARANGIRQMLALIGDSANTGSIALHARCGFSSIGTMTDVGFKLGRWLDVVTMQKTL